MTGRHGQGTGLAADSRNKSATKLTNELEWGLKLAETTTVCRNRQMSVAVGFYPISAFKGRWSRCAVIHLCGNSDLTYVLSYSRGQI